MSSQTLKRVNAPNARQSPGAATNIGRHHHTRRPKLNPELTTFHSGACLTIPVNKFKATKMGETFLAFHHSTSSPHIRITFLQDDRDRSVFGLQVSSKPRHPPSLSLQVPIDPDECLAISVQSSKSGKSPHPSSVAF